jgi:hypothetical protein
VNTPIENNLSNARDIRFQKPCLSRGPVSMQTFTADHRLRAAFSPFRRFVG